MEDEMVIDLMDINSKLMRMKAELNHVQHQGLIGKLDTAIEDIRSAMAPKLRYALLETAIYKSVELATNVEADKIAASEVASRVLELLLNDGKVVGGRRVLFAWTGSELRHWSSAAALELGLRSLFGLVYFIENVDAQDLMNWPPSVLEQQAEEGELSKRLEAKSTLFQDWLPNRSIESTPRSLDEGLSMVMAAIEAKSGVALTTDKSRVAQASALLHKIYLFEDCKPSAVKKLKNGRRKPV